MVFHDTAVAGRSMDHDSAAAIKAYVIDSAVSVIVVTDDIAGFQFLICYIGTHFAIDAD